MLSPKLRPAIQEELEKPEYLKLTEDEANLAAAKAILKTNPELVEETNPEDKMLQLLAKIG